MNERKGLSGEHAWVEERLSAYIDDQLASNERARLERHLDGCAECRASLASLRWTVTLVRQAPVPAIPRSFALPRSAATVRDARPATPRRLPTFAFGAASLATALATLLLLAAVGLDAITHLGAGRGAVPPSAAPAAPNVAFQSARPTSVARAQATEPAQESAAVPTSPPEPMLAPSRVTPAPTALPPTSALPSTSEPAPTSVGSIPSFGTCRTRNIIALFLIQ
ncbi:MAG: zf-HC2 domain-containing protein, partial [Chloroflexi bacterium]|nr:zf-HC2 domain-containing protein [Chloroflexota bacterium]